MKVLVIYDSLYGNTEKIARAIAGAVTGDVKLLRVGEANVAEIGTVDLLIMGSPTQGGRHTKAMRDFLDKIPAGSLKNVKVAAFDTRIKTMLVKIFGYAAGRIADTLKDRGGTLIAPPEGFIVKGTKGPEGDGEMERAAAWAKQITGNK
ncbi:MAG: flavodoxin [Chloroflexi bacterium RBG_16_56_11]|nr:MAG: flavodoxin [Chloroflexi bacterium RBG_16_56_11]